jgi:hypothetical protein
MANVVPYAFKQGILKGQHDLTVLNSYYLALFTSATPYTASSTVYSSADANQVGTVGTNYTTDGKTCGQGVVAQTGDYTTVDFTTDPTWTVSTITARTGVLYKYVAPGGTTANQYLVAILDFGADITSTSGDFKVTFPSATAGAPSGSGALLSITGNP